jgi:TPR repeat protein
MREQPVDAALPNADTLEVSDDAFSLARDYWRAAAASNLTESMHAIAVAHANYCLPRMV